MIVNFTFAAVGPHKEYRHSCQHCARSWPCDTVRASTYYAELRKVLEEGMERVAWARPAMRSAAIDEFGDEILELNSEWEEQGLTVPSGRIP